GDELAEMCGQCCSPRGIAKTAYDIVMSASGVPSHEGSGGDQKMLNKTEQSDRAPDPNEKPENCYCSALPKGSGLCLPCYTRWLAGERPRPPNLTTEDSLSVLSGGW